MLRVILNVQGFHKGETCLHKSARKGHDETTRLLLAAGIHVNQQNDNGVCFLIPLLSCLGLPSSHTLRVWKNLLMGHGYAWA